MHTPTYEQWQTVIDNFKKVLPLATLENHLNMNEPEVNDAGHLCGTIHCAGGWYAIAVFDQAYLSAHKIDYEHGALKMAEHLGFRDKEQLKLWADNNPSTWGNQYGHSMFIDIAAYNYANNLSEVITYLEGVRDRSPKKTL